jgi:hypothetical protein
MRCRTVRRNLPGYVDGALASPNHARLQEHLSACEDCRVDLEGYRKLAVLLASKPVALPPPDLAVRIRVAAAQERSSQEAGGHFLAWRQHLGVVLNNAFRSVALPATGGFFSAVIVFLFVLQLIVPGITVRAVQNDVPLNLLRPAALLSLCEYPTSFGSDQNDAALALPHGLLVDVTVDAQGQMVDYQILSGPKDRALRRQLDQVLLFSRFRPMMSFGRPTSGGHVVLSFSEVRVKG